MIASIELDDIPSPALVTSKCTCCDKPLSRVSGKLFDLEDEHMADYVITWHREPSPKPATFDFIFKKWNEDSELEEGAGVSLLFHRDEKTAGVQLIDGNPELLKLEGVVRVYSKEEIREWLPMQQLVQQACQFILSNDDRLAVIRTLSGANG